MFYIAIKNIIQKTIPYWGAARNFSTDGRFFWNKGTFINISSTTTKDHTGKDFGSSFLLDALKAAFSMTNSYHGCTQFGHFS